MLLCSTALCSYAQQNNENIEANKIATDKSQSCVGGCCGGTNSQAPIGIMTDHIHSKGTWMLSYTYMNTAYKGNYIGANTASDQTVYKNYMMAPETMQMQMHMAMLMYGVTDRLTLMAMGGYMSMKMSMNTSDKGGMMYMNGAWMYMPPGTSMGMQSSSSGFTDTKISALYNFSKKTDKRMIASIGINLPTGAIKATGTTMLGDNQRLPYDMQPGTGSFSINPDITYVREYRKFFWGADAGADIKLNFNTLGYKVGNIYQASVWAGYQVFSCLGVTLRASDVITDRISGADTAIAIPVYEQNDPTTPTSNYGGNIINVYAGINFHLTKPALNKFRLLAEYGIPVYQNLNGTQMALKSNLYIGLQYSF